MRELELALCALLAFLLPVAIYCFILAILNRRGKPLLVSGVWDSVGLLFAPPIFNAAAPIADAAALQPAAAAQSEAFYPYEDALRRFKSVLAERRTQIDAKQPLPNLPGQALYLARVDMMSTYKDLTDAVPSRIGRPLASTSSGRDSDGWPE